MKADDMAAGLIRMAKAGPSVLDFIGTPGNLDGVHIPHDADPALVWAVGREYDMRTARYQAPGRGVVLAWDLYACGPGPSSCRCATDCEFPCWQREGIADPCTECGCHLAAVKPVTEGAGQPSKETELSVSQWPSAS